MAFEPVYEEVHLNSRRRICQNQAVVEARLLPQPNIAIAKVLSISCDCAVSSSEVFAGEARYAGSVDFKVLFVDGEGVTRSMDYSAQFSDKMNEQDITATLRPLLSAAVLDTDIVSVNSGEIKLAAVVEIMLDADVTDSVKFLTNGGDGIYTNGERTDFSRLVASSSQTVNYSGTLNDLKIKNVLTVENKAVITSRTAAVDSVKIDGNIISEVYGETEDGLIAAYQLVTPFSEELPAEGARPDDKVIASAKLNTKTAFETDGEVGAVTFDYTVMFTYSVYSDDAFEAVVDAFSVTNELLKTLESVDVYKNKQSATLNDRVEGNVTLELNMPIVDNILAATAFKVTVTNVVSGEDEVTVEGIVSGNVIYFSAEQNSKNSVAVELPFSLNLRLDGIDPSDTVSGKGEVTKVNVKIRRGNELDIRADIALELDVFNKATKTVISELNEGEERAVPTAAFSIHIAKAKESLWDIAKALGTTPELVLAQNPDLELPLSGGERVIAYRHLTK